MKLNASITAAAVAAALFALAGCEQKTDSASVGNAPRYSQERAVPAPSPSDKMADRSASSVPESAQPESSQGVGQTFDDASITAKVKAALLASSDVQGSVISVRTEQGHVTLRGKVLDETQIDRAVQIARAVTGVRDVDNQLSASESS
ncbi:MAG: BON domain-containing protein [Burkholderiales bacterium]